MRGGNEWEGSLGQALPMAGNSHAYGPRTCSLQAHTRHLPAFLHSIPPPFCKRYYYLHPTEHSEAQRGQATCPKSHS